MDIVSYESFPVAGNKFSIAALFPFWMKILYVTVHVTPKEPFDVQSHDSE